MAIGKINPTERENMDYTKGVVGAYNNLASAIVLQAIRDYCNAKERLAKYTDAQIQYRHETRHESRRRLRKRLLDYKQENDIDICEYRIKECEVFFHSERFKRLTDVIDGEVLLQMLKEKVG